MIETLRNHGELAIVDYTPEILRTDELLVVPTATFSPVNEYGQDRVKMLGDELGMQVVTYDHPGTGDSYAAPSGMQSYADLTPSIWQSLEEKYGVSERPSVHIAGFSGGAYSAAFLAEGSPEGVDIATLTMFEPMTKHWSNRLIAVPYHFYNTFTRYKEDHSQVFSPYEATPSENYSPAKYMIDVILNRGTLHWHDMTTTDPQKAIVGSLLKHPDMVATVYFAGDSHLGNPVSIQALETLAENAGVDGRLGLQMHNGEGTMANHRYYENPELMARLVASQILDDYDFNPED